MPCISKVYLTTLEYNSAQMSIFVFERIHLSDNKKTKFAVFVITIVINGTCLAIDSQSYRLAFFLQYILISKNIVQSRGRCADLTASGFILTP